MKFISLYFILLNLDYIISHSHSHSHSNPSSLSNYDDDDDDNIEINSEYNLTSFNHTLTNNDSHINYINVLFLLFVILVFLCFNCRSNTPYRATTMI